MDVNTKLKSINKTDSNNDEKIIKKQSDKAISQNLEGISTTKNSVGELNKEESEKNELSDIDRQLAQFIDKENSLDFQENREMIHKVLEKGLFHKKQGNKLFKQKLFKEAAEEYSQAISYFDIDQNVKELLLSTNIPIIKIEVKLNWALCLLNLNKFNDVISLTNEVKNLF